MEMDIANGIACESVVCQMMNRPALAQPRRGCGYPPLRQRRGDVLVTAPLRGGTIGAQEYIKGKISGKQTDWMAFTHLL